jgi:hypothetical protein
MLEILIVTVSRSSVAVHEEVDYCTRVVLITSFSRVPNQLTKLRQKGGPIATTAETIHNNKIIFRGDLDDGND